MLNITLLKMIKWNYLTISKRTISRRKKNHSKFLFYSSWIHVWSLEVENLILMYHGGLIYFVWLCEIWGCFGIPILFSRYKITEKQTLKSPLIPAASRSFEHLQHIKQSLTDLLNYKWDIQRFHLNLCEFVHFLYGTKIPANGFWKN